MPSSWSAGAGLASISFALVASLAVADAAPSDNAPTTCMTRLHVVVGETVEHCAAETRDEVDRLHKNGLLDAEPVVAVRANGDILRGITTVTLVGGHGRVTVSDGALSCSGDYNNDDRSTVMSFPFRCTDGRTGIATRTSLFLHQGNGTVRLSDGETARFAFGCLTRVGDIPTCPVVQAARLGTINPASPPLPSR